ncbi:hypothetical protein A4R44_03217 [Amycolatopsis sp. M39]|nr:hypothetical protein A4R44_03217 [Amycolatopsis sp. M39]
MYAVTDLATGQLIEDDPRGDRAPRPRIPQLAGLVP